MRGGGGGMQMQVGGADGGGGGGCGSQGVVGCREGVQQSLWLQSFIRCVSLQ
jgi:hypothetical protein